MDLGKRKHRNILYAASIKPFHWEGHPSLQVPRNVVSFQKARHLFENVRKCPKVPEVCIVEDSKIGIPLFRKNRPVLCLCQLLIGHGCPVSTLQNSEHNKHQQTSTNINKPCGGSLDDSGCFVDDSGCLDDPVDCSVLFSSVLRSRPLIQLRDYP